MFVNAAYNINDYIETQPSERGGGTAESAEVVEGRWAFLPAEPSYKPARLFPQDYTHRSAETEVAVP